MLLSPKGRSRVDNCEIDFYALVMNRVTGARVDLFIWLNTTQSGQKPTSEGSVGSHAQHGCP